MAENVITPLDHYNKLKKKREAKLKKEGNIN